MDWKVCVSGNQNDCLREQVCSLLFRSFGLTTSSITHLMRVEYLRNPMGPVAKHISTVPANPLVLVPSPTRRVTSSLHLICKRYRYQKFASVVSSELHFIKKDIINLLMIKIYQMREPRIIFLFYTYNWLLLINCTYENVLSVHADDTKEDRQRGCQQQSGVLESISQRKDPWTDVTLEQMHHGFQVPAVVQFQFVSAFDLFSTRYDVIRRNSVSQDNESSDISGILLIIGIMAMNQKVNMNIWYAFQIYQEEIL